LFVVLAIVAPPYVAIGFARAQTSGRRLAAIAVPPVCGTLIVLILVVRLSVLARVARRRADELTQALAKQDQLQQQLVYRAHHDSLTGLANRDVLTERMDRLHGTDNQVHGGSAAGHALMMLDLDGFKNVNDTLGHPAGDKLLVNAAQRLVNTVPDKAVVVRLGGDEFAVFMENTRADEARRTADAIVAAMHNPYVVGGQELSLSASLGLLITEPEKRPPTSAEGLRDADRALYDSKAAGRDRVTEFAAQGP
jgi:diguanylate cyclase (GGDEF)-like protein